MLNCYKGILSSFNRSIEGRRASSIVDGKLLDFIVVSRWISMLDEAGVYGVAAMCANVLRRVATTISGTSTTTRGKRSITSSSPRVVGWMKVHFHTRNFRGLGGENKGTHLLTWNH